MFAHALEWSGLLVRWFHLIAGIGWIGSSFYFMWLDSALAPADPPRPGVEGELWMVHSGGFYQVEKRLIGPGTMPTLLHWFKFEALLTWVSGMFLLGLVYYVSGGVFLIDPERARLTVATAVAASLGVIAASWVVYDGLWASRLADARPRLATALSFALLVAVAWGLCRLFSGRAAFIHVGAVLGTVMVANVWHRILPAQRQMIAATQAGRQPDYTLGLRAKRRSVHNSYVTLPVVFMMVSNHYPALYGHSANWVVLILMIFVGAVVRHAMIVQAKRRSGWPWLFPAAVALAAVIGMTWTGGTPAGGAAGPAVTDAEVQAIVDARCSSCHGARPTDDVFTAPPNGVILATPQDLRARGEVVRLRVIETETMPLANKTAMTPDERARLGRWLAQP